MAKTKKATINKDLDLPAERLMLVNPGLFIWAVAQSTSSRLIDHQERGQALMHGLDSAPFIGNCWNHTRCGRIASFACAYAGTSTLTLWCDHCDPSMQGSRTGTLHELHNYRAVVEYGQEHLRNKASISGIVRKYLECKGLPTRLGSVDEVVFFDRVRACGNGALVR